MSIYKISNTNNAPTFFRIISQDPEYVEGFCNDLNNPFQFTFRKWFSDNQSP